MNLLKKSLIAPGLALLLSTSLNAKENYTINTTSLGEAIKQISKISKLPYIVDMNILKGKKANPIRDVEDLKTALDTILKGTGLEAVISNKTIVIRKIVSDKKDKKQNTTQYQEEIEIIGTLNNVSEGNDSYAIEAMNTATRLMLSNKETPQSVSVVTRKMLDDLGLTTAEEALKTVTGINAVSSAGSYRFQSRGFYVDQIQEDGISSTTDGAMYNQFRTDNPASDLAIYDHIEVVRGATGLSQGNGEPGGTINFVRKKPAKDLQASAAFTVGSWNKRRMTTDVSSANKEKDIRARVVSVLEKSDSFKDKVESKTKEFYSVVDFDLSDDTILSVGFDYLKKNGVPDVYGLPLDENGNDLNLNTSTFLGANWNRYDIEKKNAFLELDHSFNDNWKLESKLNYRKIESSSAFTGLIASSSGTYGIQSDNLAKVNNLQKYDNTSTVKSFQTDLTGMYELFGQNHELFTGLIFSKEEYNSRWRRQLNSDTYNIYTFSGDIAEPDWDDTSSLFNDSYYKYRLYQSAINLGTRLNFTDKTHLLLGTRYTYFKTDGYNYDAKWGSSTNDLYLETKINKHKFIPYVGLTYDVDELSTLYASYTSIFKPSVRKAADKTLLDPVIGSNYEVGIKSSLLENRLNTSLSLFTINQKNRAVYNSNISAYEPIGEVKSKGFDIQVNGKVTDRLLLSSGYTYNTSKYLKTESSKYTEGLNYSKHTPKHMLKVYTNYRLPIDNNKWSVGLGVNTQSETESIYGVKQGGISIWNGSVNYNITKKMNLKLNANNIFDKRYYLTNISRDSDFNNFYGDPRNFALTLSWKL